MNLINRIYLTAVLLLLFFVFTPLSAFAITNFDVTRLRGQVLGIDGKPLKLAQITATCDGQTKHTITGGKGKYIVVFIGKGICEAGDTVTVTAEKDGKTGTTSGPVQLRRDGKYVDLNFSVLNINFSVPEFGLIPGILAALTSAGAYLSLRKRK